MSARIIPLRGKVVPPEVVEQARAEAEAIAAEFDPAQLPEGDAGLIQAERWSREIGVRVDGLYDRFEWLLDAPVELKDEVFSSTTEVIENRLDNLLINSPARTTAGAAAKLRFLLEEARRGFDVSDSPSLRQVTELLERLAAE